jgi:hypothetical protein
VRTAPLLVLSLLCLSEAARADSPVQSGIDKPVAYRLAFTNVAPLWLLVAEPCAELPEAGDPLSAPGVAAPASRPPASSLWTGLPAVFAAAAVAIPVLASRSCQRAPQAVVAVASVAAVETASVPATVEAAPVPAPPAASAAPVRSARAPLPPELSADEARAQLGAIRVALARRDAPAALAILERLDRRDRRGLFAEERAVMRAEVMAASGRLAEARAAVEKLRGTMGEDAAVRRVGSAVDGGR